MKVSTTCEFVFSVEGEDLSSAPLRKVCGNNHEEYMERVTWSYPGGCDDEYGGPARASITLRNLSELEMLLAGFPGEKCRLSVRIEDNENRSMWATAYLTTSSPIAVHHSVYLNDIAAAAHLESRIKRAVAILGGAE